MKRLYECILRDIRRMDVENEGSKRLNQKQYDLLVLVVFYLVRKKVLGVDDGRGILLLGQGTFLVAQFEFINLTQNPYAFI